MELQPKSEKYCDKKKQPHLFDFEASMELPNFNHIGYGNLPALMSAEVNYYYCNALEMSELKRDRFSR